MRKDGRADGQTTHRHEERSIFRNYIKAPNKNSVRSSHRNQCAFKRKSKRWETYTFYKNHNVTNKHTMQTKCRVFSVKLGRIHTNPLCCVRLRNVTSTEIPVGLTIYQTRWLRLSQLVKSKLFANTTFASIVLPFFFVTVTCVNIICAVTF